MLISMAQKSKACFVEIQNLQEMRGMKKASEPSTCGGLLMLARKKGSDRKFRKLSFGRKDTFTDLTRNL